MSGRVWRTKTPIDKLYRVAERTDGKQSLSDPDACEHFSVVYARKAIGFALIDTSRQLANVRHRQEDAVRSEDFLLAAYLKKARS